MGTAGLRGKVEILAIGTRGPEAGSASAAAPLFHRFSMVVDNGIVKALNVEPDGTGLTCSLASSILSQL